MPKRSSNKPPADEVLSAFSTIQQIIARTESEPVDEVGRLKARTAGLERLCSEVREFARVGRLPVRVIDALDAAARGRPLPPGTLFPITPDDVPSDDSPAVTLGRLGGLKGGKARADALSSRRKTEIARKAATTRWRKHRAK